MYPTKMITVHTGVPEQCYPQEVILDYYMARVAPDSDRRQRAMRSVFNASGVARRFSVVEPEFFLSPKTTQQRNDRYIAEALPLGRRVIEEGLQQAGISAQDITSFYVVSCTGISMPGLDLLLAHELGMRPQLNRACVLGMGCYGAFPGLRLAWEHVQARPEGLALVLAVELCTLHTQFDATTESLVSASLFADGAAMAVLGQADSGARLPALVDSETYSDYRTLDHMSFTLTDAGFYMSISSYVPDVLAANIQGFVSGLLARNDLHPDDIRFWAIHPGSKRIVEYIQAQLCLSDAQVAHSLDVLQDYGNISSATVLFILNCMIQSGAPQPGDYGVMMAFGPGLTMEALLVRW